MGSLTGFTQTEKSVEKEGVAGRGVIWLWLAWLDVSGVVGTVFFYPRPRQYSWQLSAHLLIPCLPLPWLSFCCRYPCQNVQQHKGSAGHTSHLWVRLKLKHATRCVLLTLSTCFSWIPLRNILPSLCFFFFFFFHSHSPFPPSHLFFPLSCGVAAHLRMIYLDNPTIPLGE